MGYKRRSHIFEHNFAKRGFALPTILISSIVMLTVLLVSVSSTTAVRTAILNQYYTQLAQVAGDAGVAYAQACLAQNGNVPLWSDVKPLTPATDCSGNSIATPTANILVVAGGGGGSSGGGGAGGVTYLPAQTLVVQNYTVTVGAGGAGCPANATSTCTKGGNSLFGSFITTLGGGYGGRNDTAAGATSGGSGGGGGATSTVQTNGGAGTAAQGNTGGTVTSTYFGAPYPAAGGGGAGGPGGNPVNTTTSGNGGIGIISNITGANVYYGGGGGGANNQASGTHGTGGLGGGASPSSNTGAVANTGGGGGGAVNGFNGGNGATGVVIVSYPTGALTANVTGGTCSPSGSITVCTFTSASGSFNVTSVGFSCPGDSHCYVTSNGNIRSSFSVGLPSLDANGKAVTIPNTGYVQVLRTSTGTVWRTYNQPAAQSAVVPDLCSGTATSALGWGNAVKQSVLSVLVVAGGGSGGGSTGGGGGGGGILSSTSVAVSVQNYPVVVGAGGVAPGSQAIGKSGGNSSFNGLNAIGGGGGGFSSSAPSGAVGLSGGSGGGGQNYYGSFVSGSGTAGQGYAGGALGTASGAGGGGAGGIGLAGVGTNIGGNGGPGVVNNITGANVYYGGGGGGGLNGLGGLGGGGKSAVGGVTALGSPGLANTGGGGGGGWDYAGGNGGTGGSGVVIVSYPTGSITATGGTITSSGGNTIQTFTSSGTFTVSSVQAVQSGWSGFPDNTAIPIGISSGSVMPGPIYFRKDFSVINAGTYNLNVLTEDSAQAYVDGGLVATSSNALASGSVALSVGCHTLTAKLTHGGIQNSGAYIVASLKKSGTSLPIVVSDTTWRVTAGTSKHYSQVGYYADPASWTPARDIQAANTSNSAWGTTSGDANSRWISTTHSYDGSGNYPTNQFTLFRDTHDIFLSTSATVRVSMLCDDACYPYLDGNLINTGISGSQGVVTMTITLSEGYHKFAFLAFNLSGPSGFAFAAVNTNDGTVLSRSDKSWSAANFWSAANPTSSYSYDNSYMSNPVVSTSYLAKVLVVGGGGGGGSDMGGGGGGGGVVYNSAFTIRPGNYAVTVGAGGTGAAAGISQARGVNGSVSQFDSLFALGGGGGGSEYSTNNSPPGGGASGGGSAGCVQNTIGLGIVGQGYSGGATPGCYYPTGGGGAGGSGGANPGTGGGGISNNILGPNYYWGGGGGGAGYSGIAGNGGMGGGGGGAPKVSGGGLGGGGALNPGSDGTVGVLVAQTNVPGGNAGANTGGGGGGGSHYNSNNYGGNGGSGIVVVSFPTGSLTATANGVACPTSGGNTVCTFTSSGTFTVVSIP